MDTAGIPKDQPRVDASRRSSSDEDTRAASRRKRDEASAGPPRPDIVELTDRARIEAARGQATGVWAPLEDAPGDRTEVAAWVGGITTELDGSSAAAAAREAAAQILAYPAVAARAQANNDCATVLAMLQ